MDPSPAEPFGALLRRHRRAAGLSQEELAGSARLSVEAISALERGVRRAPYRATVELLADALALTMEQRAGFIAAVDRRREPGVIPPAPPDPARSNLPAPITSFVGREREQATVLRLLESSRLLTLTGTGGVGKTRLAFQVATGLAPDYADGIRLVELAALNDPALVPQAAARALDVREEPGRPLAETLAAAMSERELLLVLDNCEHLREAAAALAEALLRTGRRLRILATSREALGLVDETVWRVPSLAVPSSEFRTPSGDRQNPELGTRNSEPATIGPPRHTARGVGRAEAVQLFCARATAAYPAFVLDDANALVVAAICRRLDGIPLAIELAAARARVLAPEQIAARLDARLRLLTRGNEGALPRQRTLRAALDWSWELLAEPERTLLARLAVFPGGCDLEAAETICADDPVDLLHDLVEKSLVIVEYRGETARYRLLETVREYAAERLDEAGLAEDTRARLRGWALALLELAAPQLRGPGQAIWLDRLDAEHDNVRAVLADAIESGRFTDALQLAGRAGSFWSMRGYWSEGRRGFERLLPHAEAAPAGVRALALLRAGKLAEQQGAYDEALPLVRQSLDLFRETEDEVQQFHATSLLGMLAWRQSDLTRSAELHEAALTLARDIGDGALISSSLNNLAVLAMDGSRLEAARDYLDEALALARVAGDAAGISMRLNNLAMLAIRMGDLQSARGHAEEALALDRRTGIAATIPNHLRRLAEIHLGQGDTDTAHRYAAEALALARSRGDQFEVAEALDHLARVAIERSDLHDAETYGRDSLRIARDLGTQRQIWIACERLGHLARRAGEWRRAVTLFGAAAAVRTVTGEVSSEGAERQVASYLAEMRTEAGDEAVATAWAEGAAMSSERAVAFALDDPWVPSRSRPVLPADHRPVLSPAH